MNLIKELSALIGEQKGQGPTSHELSSAISAAIADYEQQIEDAAANGEEDLMPGTHGVLNTSEPIYWNSVTKALAFTIFAEVEFSDLFYKVNKDHSIDKSVNGLSDLENVFHGMHSDPVVQAAHAKRTGTFRKLSTDEIDYEPN